LPQICVTLLSSQNETIVSSTCDQRDCRMIVFTRRPKNLKIVSRDVLFEILIGGGWNKNALVGKFFNLISGRGRLHACFIRNLALRLVLKVPYFWTSFCHILVIKVLIVPKISLHV